MHIYLKSLLHVSIVLLLSIFYCEYAIFELSLLSCSWPQLKNGESEELHVLFLADPHLLGPYRGSPLDKLRREWQMKRCFQAARERLQPDYVVILGDLFDEGELVDEQGWDEYLRRFYEEIFYMPDRSKLKVIVGNHDIGFHDTVVYDTRMWKRFKEQFGLSSSVNLFHLKHRMFLSINSMAMENDDYCDFCYYAKKDLYDIQEKLHLTKREKQQCNCSIVSEDHIHCKLSLDRPVILQHFPLYRDNELQCVGFNDGPTVDEASKRNKENWDVLSKESTDYLLQNIQPCLAISGHTHHGCFVDNKGVFELSVPSFSWRNLNNPSIVLGVFVKDDVILQKCTLPRESTIIAVYIATIFFVVFIVVSALVEKRRCIKNNLKTH